MHPGCPNAAINSHLLQHNGILNHITEKGHLIEIKPASIYEVTQKGFFNQRRVGINNAISYPLFCSQHDTSNFQAIEKPPINFSSYTTQLLFSYRPACAELWKKRKELEVYSRIKSSAILNIGSALDATMEGTRRGITDLESYKVAFENDVNNLTENFTFYTFSCGLIKLSSSAVTSPSDPDDMQTAAMQTGPLAAVFINLIPQPSELLVVVGRSNVYSNDWCDGYVQSWASLNTEQLEIKTTHLLSQYIETWNVSESLFNSFSPLKIKQFLSLLETGLMSPASTLDDNEFNLFR